MIVAEPVVRVDLEAARELIAHNLAEFRHLVSEAQAQLASGRPEAAAVYAGVAAHSAACMHPGLYQSPELEQVIWGIASRAKIGFTSSVKAERRLQPEHVLHVFSAVGSIGGHTRMVWRWIQQDGERMHSVAITRQAANPVPRALEDAVASSGGRLHRLDEGRGSLLTWARRLRAVAASADLVVLHVNPEDVVAPIAFADRSSGPRIVYLDHADHLFWPGVYESDVVCALRASGRRLARERRGVEEGRSVLLPIIVPPAERTISRSEAKSQLGLDEKAIVLLTVARGVKYRTIDGVSLAGSLVPLIQEHPEAVLLLVGPEPDAFLEAASRQTGGRVIAFGPRTDTATFLQAADIYVDSFPIVSTTSLLEAGSFGLPLVSLCPDPTREASTLCADAPGLDGCLIQAANLRSYLAALSGLIEDAGSRLALGEKTRRQIESVHGGPGWQEAVQELYRTAVSVPSASGGAGLASREGWNAEDALAVRLLSAPISRSDLLAHHARLLPADLRLRFALSTIKPRPSLMLPEWIYVRVRPWWRRLRSRRHGS